MCVQKGKPVLCITELAAAPKGVLAALRKSSSEFSLGEGRVKSEPPTEGLLSHTPDILEL